MKPVRTLMSAVAALSMVVLAACTTSPEHRSLGTALDDTAISAKVKTALVADPEVKAREVQVETYRGTVQLSGFVDSPEKARRAVDVARRIEGVRDVRNALLVK